MKNNLIFSFTMAFFMLLSFSTINAQFSLKPYVGINSTTLTNDLQDDEFKSGIGYQFGIDLLIGRRIYIQPGLYYELSNVGVISSEDIPDLKISRLNVPVFLGFKMFAEDVDKFFDIRIFTGPSASFVTNFDSGKDGLAVSGDNVRNFNLAWNAGLGIDIFMFFVDVAYKWDVNDFFRNEMNSDASQNVFFVNAGLRFNF
ncbi:MAG: hypothetical protein EA362_12545 [Saprospirales bacterium]|nr:MAG: hypothetical protein EA362_12545 [Saprospirales bacterium]